MSKFYKRLAFDISMLDILYQVAAGKQKNRKRFRFTDRARGWKHNGCMEGNQEKNQFGSSQPGYK